MTRRNTELFLLIATIPVVFLFFAIYFLNDAGSFQASDFVVPAGLFLAFIVCHVAMRFLTPNADPALLPITFCLAAIGILFVMRLNPDQSIKQVVWLFVGVAAMILTMVLVKDARKLGHYKWISMILGVILLMLPAVVGATINGSKIWLNFAGLSFQPGEIAKILIVLFLAGYLAENREMLSVSGRRHLGINFPDFRTLVPLLVMWVISLAIVAFEKDLGSALLFFGIFVIMIYVATGRKAYVLMALLLGIVGAIGLYQVFGHVQERVAVWLNPFATAQSTGYQLVQSLYALADGGLLGKGVGAGMPTLIPVVSSDFIFVAICEELGLLGGACVLILFVLFAVRGFLIASRAKSDSEAFTAAGLTASISLQAFLICAGTTMLIPLTGVTLPFMSQGGSSLLSSFIIIGLLLRVSDNATGPGHEIESQSSFGEGVLGRIALGKRLTAMIVSFCILFAGETVNLAYQMTIRADQVNAMPANTQKLLQAKKQARGDITTADGVVLAKSVQNADGTYSRVYPQDSMAAQVVGYYSQQYGMSGVENTMSAQLEGQSGFTSISEMIQRLANIDTPGDAVQLTLDSRLQQTAQQVLDGYDGAAICLDASTGAVLAEASAPTYDANQVTKLLAGKTSGVVGGSGRNSGSALINRATSALYAPGSTFKIITLTSALENTPKHDGSPVSLSSVYQAPGTMKIGNAAVTNYGGESFGALSLKQAFQYSANTVFGQVATEVGAKQLVATADDFGFGRQLGLDFNSKASVMPEPEVMTKWETAWAGIGQPVGQHVGSPSGPQTNVLQMASVVAAFADHGKIMDPYVVQKVTGPKGEAVASTTPQLFAQPSALTPSVLDEVNSAMKAVVAGGTATAAQIPGYTVRGKTGTAQTGAKKDNSWFVGWTTIAGRPIVVGVLCEQAATGTAVPKAKRILEKAIDLYGGSK
ncbi:MAG: FtsW/RodA/SpoVE family cell cycle protein [Coriobacteriales bacterium]|jgi:peptidoglycan glycosyltransferase|nr:FtsW/RodA/SpoVE family cell cycle protein [Coriobacteriales bacterium]